MNFEVVVDEAVQVLVRTLPSGKLLPTSFVWRDRTRYVADVGRQWEERIGGEQIRCFLVKTVDNSTYELHWHPAGDQWRIHRAWMQNLA